MYKNDNAVNLSHFFLAKLILYVSDVRKQDSKFFKMRVKFVFCVLC